MTHTVFPDSSAMARACAEYLLELSELTEGNRPVHIALSGGTTPQLVYKMLASDPWKNGVSWEGLHFWWGDERMVPWSDDQSNYGVATRLLFDRLPREGSSLPVLHPIHGSAPLEDEVTRYSLELRNGLSESEENRPSLPRFDLVILGMGDDGHTASLFPGMAYGAEDDIAIGAVHPISGQKRVSLSGAVLSSAERMLFLVGGGNKSEIVGQIFSDPVGSALKYPAAQVALAHGSSNWFLDGVAASKLS